MTGQSATRLHLTGRVVLALGLLLGLYQLASTTGNAWFVVLAGGVAGLVVAGFATRPSLDGLTVEVAHAPRVRVGDQLAVRLTVTNGGARPTSEVKLCLHTAGLADVVCSVGRLDPGDRSSVVVERRAVARTVAEGSTVHLAARPSLGFLAGERELTVDDRVVVHPVLPAVAVPQLAGRAETEETDRVRTGAGTEVVGIREWRSSDDRGRVHWRSTARTGRLTTLERGEPESYELRLVLVGADTGPEFEAALSAAAATSVAALRHGARVAAVAWHVDGPVLAGVGSRLELLDWWSSVHHTALPDPAHFGRTALAGFGPGGLLVAGPPELDARWLSAAAAHCPGLALRPLLVPA